MNALFKFTRIILAMMFALGAIGFSASAALAAPPNNFDWTFNAAYTDNTTCSFDINVTFSGTVHEIDHFDNNGVMTKGNYSVVEQDTFTANGVILVSDLYHNEQYNVYDSGGNIISSGLNGVSERIRLPSGRLVFISAGRINWFNHSGSSISTDIGNPGDVAAFCEAFAP